jgi:propionyl-CoA carboxylase alpha chain
MTAAACWMHRLQVRRARSNGGKLFAAPVRVEFVVVIGEHKRTVKLSGEGLALDIELVGEGRRLGLESVDWRPGQRLFKAVLTAGEGPGHAFSLETRPALEGFVIRHRAAKANVLVLTPLSAELHERLPKKQAADTSRLIVSPMPGLVVSLDVTPGREVKAGEAVAVIEAMKMQNIIKAERDGVVKSVGVKAGDSVAADEVLVEFA